MSRPSFGKKSVQLQRPRVDRFIPPRESFADERRRGSWRFESPEKTVNIWEPSIQKQKNYKKYLDEVFGMEPFKTAESKKRKRPENEAYLQPWPCVPRKRGYLSSADSILDLPSYSLSSFPEVLDWSKNNMLVAALGKDYHMFSWVKQNVSGQGATVHSIHCCRFDPRGDFLLIGCRIKIIELHDAIQSKKVSYAICNCGYATSFGFFYNLCEITAIDWSPTGNSFITGCSRGKLASFDRRSMLLNTSCIESRNPVRSVKISPDTRYVAVVYLDIAIVYILAWPSLKSYSQVDASPWIVKTICWHPWRSALLALGLMTNLRTTIIMLDTPSSKARQFNLDLFNYCSLDVMLFSSNTGELVLSLWNLDQESSSQKNCAQLLVMSDPQNVVDHSWNGLDRMRTMVLSPDGTKLATATAEEDLIIWNFLPEDKKSKISRTKNFKLLPAYLDKCAGAVVLR